MAEPLARRLRLMLVSPGDRAPAATEGLARAALEGGVTALLLREPQLPSGARRALYARLLAMAREHGALAVVSGDLALAAELGADGVQLGHGAPDPDAARAVCPGAVVGRSAHWPLQPADLRADYATLSPFAPTPRSHPRPLLTSEQIEHALARLAPRPVLALGGLDAAAVPELPDGLAGVAVRRAVADARDPAGAAAQLRALLDARLDFGGGAEARA